jgi:hypothetical protein
MSYAVCTHATTVSQGRWNPRRRLKSSTTAMAARWFTGIAAEKGEHSLALV